MNKKTGLLALLFATILTLPSASALTVEAQEPQQLVDNNSLILSPDESVQVDLQFGLEGNETEVEVGAADYGDFEITQPFGVEDPPYTDGDSFVISVNAPSKSNYTKQMTFDFEVTMDDGNETSTKTVTETINATTKIPYSVLDEGSSTWYNKSYQFNIGGTAYNITELRTNAVVFDGEDNSSFQLGGSESNAKTVNDVRITKQDQVPNSWAKLMFESRDDVNPEFSTKLIEKEKQPTKCMLGLRTRSPIVRGNDFSFTVFDKNAPSSDNGVSGVNVLVEGTKSGVGVIAEGQSRALGRGSVSIPETMYQDHPDATQVSVTLTQQDGGNCQPLVNEIVPIDQSWSSFAQENEEYQLQMTVDNTTTYGDITGSVTDAEGNDVDTGILEVTTPEDETVEASISESSYNYEPESSGVYTIQGTKSGFIPTEEVEVEYIADRDGDGVANSRDECPDESGVEANNGCPKQTARLSVTGQERGGANELYKNSVYGLSLRSQGQTINYSGPVSVKGTDVSFNVDDGVVSGTEQEGLMFDETGEYTLVFNGTGYEPVEETYTVVNKPFIPEGMAMPLGGGAVLVILVLVAVKTDILSRLFGGGGGSSSSTDPGADMSTQLDPTGGDN